MTGGLMRAATIEGPGSAGLRSAPLPEPAAGEVRVRLEGCGVCGSNGPVWEGRPWFEYPLAPGAPGHEGWGVIDAIGDGVESLAAGDRVALLSQRAFAEYDVAAADALVRLPAALDGMPFPGEALGCGMNVFRRSGIAAGHTVAVVGIGFIGAIVTALAVRAGARVIAVSRRDFALEIGRGYGASDALRLGDDGLESQVRERTDGHGCDVVVEAVGVQAALDAATRLTSEHGRLIIAGYHQDGLRQVDMQLWNWRGLDVINAHERKQETYVAGMRAAVDAVADGSLDVRPLLTHRFALDRLDGALNALHERPDGFMKALVTL
jgi:threonine dehydrogenase-like Zn-dependent dehydrogenase